MKTIQSRTLVLFIALSLPYLSLSQVKLGIKAGLNSSNVGENVLVHLEDGNNSVRIKTKDINFGYHIGPILRFKLLGIRAETGLLYNVDKTSIDFESPDGGSIMHAGNSFDVPLTLGFNLLFLELHAGLMGHRANNNKPNVTQAFFDEELFSVGYLFGCAVNIKKISIGLDYEFNLSKYQENFNVGGQEFSVSERNNHVYLSLTYEI